MLELADRSEIDYVLGTEVSRLNRGEAFNFSLIRHELEQCGVRLEFLDQTLRTALVLQRRIRRPTVTRDGYAADGGAV